MSDWDSLMAATDNAVSALDMVYNQLLFRANEIKQGRGDLEEMEKLLDRTLPVTEEDRRLVFTVCFLERIRRPELVAFLFKIRRACLLLLIDGAAVVTALKVENVLDIWVDETGHYRVARCDAGAPSQAHAAREDPRGSGPREDPRGGPREDPRGGSREGSYNGGTRGGSHSRGGRGGSRGGGGSHGGGSHGAGAQPLPG
jgi:uncharacterized membrane protein YgcG